MSSATPVPEASKGSSKLKLMLIGLGAVIVAAGGFAGGLYLGTPMGGKTASPKAAPEQDAVYIPIKEPLTANLADSGRYVQLSLALSTRSGPEFASALEKHDAALRSALIVTLGALREDDIASSAAKEKLRGQLRIVINRTISGLGVEGRVDEVYFSGFLVQ